MRLILYISFLLVTFSTTVFSATENLDELHARKARISTATYTKETLEDPTTLVWNPETLAYIDSVTGTEVWRLSSTNGLKNSLPNLSWSHWSADGKRFSYGSHRDTSATGSTYETDTNQTYQGAVMMMRGDGSYLRPANGAPFEVYVHRRYLHWSPVEPDVYYGFGGDFAYEGVGIDELYKVTVGDTSIARELILDLDLDNAETSVINSMSGDGTTILAQHGNTFYPIQIYPTVSLLEDGFSKYRNLDDYWGSTPSTTPVSFHDQFLRGVDGDMWMYFMPNDKSSWWRMRLSGSGADGGPEHVVDHTAPFSFGDVEPVTTGGGSGGTCLDGYRSPWNCDGDVGTGPDQYFSHPGYAKSGPYVATINSQYARGWGVWNLDTHEWVDRNIPAPHYEFHSDWSAWSDYFITSASDDILSGLINGDSKIYSVKMDGTDTIAVADAHIQEAGATDYNALPRATQSPDGTKVTFHSDFLYADGTNAWDLYYAVAYYPHPPEITTVSSGVVRFEWSLDSTPRGYTTRGWPDEATDDPPPPRETKSFRLWKSADGSTDWEPVGTVDSEIFTRYDFSDGTWNGNDYWEITDPSPSGYYAVTAIEHSGLESRILSNVYSSTGSQEIPYPENPKGKLPFFTSPPKTPTFSVTKLEVPGYFRLDWEEPVDTLIRYYNIYYSNTTSVEPTQQNRIASIPRGINSYIDWLADQNTIAKYLITSVDSQGNESSNTLRIIDIREID